jgi:catechol 2,3-dioxygenase
LQENKQAAVIKQRNNFIITLLLGVKYFAGSQMMKFYQLCSMDSYIVPAGTRIGHIHLKVSDLDKALSFYRDLLGFEVMQYYGNSAVFVSAGGYHHHIGLNTWHSKNGGPAPAGSCGLYHTAILYPSRRDLAVVFKRLVDAKYPLSGASDHGVSEAIYLDDPDGNGVELYWDKPREQWPFDSEGNLQMLTERLDVQELLKEAAN